MDPNEMTPRKVSLEDIMRPAVSVTPDTPARAVLKVLSENRMLGVPVVDSDGHLMGFVSEGHLLASALPKYLAAMADLSFIKESGDAWLHFLAESADRPVSEVMSTEVSSLELGKSEVAVAHKMVHAGASSVMVAHLSRQLYHALHELEPLQARRLGGNAPLARLDVQGIPES